MSTNTICEDAPAHAIAEEPMSAVLMAIPAAIVVACAIVATVAPIGVSVVAVFLFAGPHNWMEARYFLARMPARWGGLAPYFSLGLAGSLMLAGLFAALPWLAGDDSENGLILVAAWNSLLTVWVVLLAQLRSRQNPRRNWPYLVPVGFGLIAVNWISPLAWSLALVYLHPLLAMMFLDREMKQQPAAWRKSFRIGLLLIPVCLVGVAASCADRPDIPERDLLTWQITRHAGADVMPRISTHFLVAAHIFLELLHYLVWVVVIPCMSGRNSGRRLRDAPLARRSPNWRRLITGIVATGAVVMLLLWGSFLTNYVWTRNVYFTVAILHVLLEIPFLIRSL